MADSSFTPSAAELARAQHLLSDIVGHVTTNDSDNSEAATARAEQLLGSLPKHLPEHPLTTSTTANTTDSAELNTLKTLAPLVQNGAAQLGNTTAFAHMDPPTPWITWITSQWNAALNQNLLHPDIADTARHIEQLVINWLAPAFSMSGGHMTPGSTVANLTALWAAREQRGIRRVISSSEAHLSIAKSCNLLGLEHIRLPADDSQRLTHKAMAQLSAEQTSNAALVLTAGTTGTGAIDELDSALRNKPGIDWLHVDAAWAGPLRLSAAHRDRLALVEHADSVAVSAHKWLYQPKEAGLVFFRDTATAHNALSFGGAYLQTPNVGLLGSHGANAIPLLATLLAWGRTGVEQRLNLAMRHADDLAHHLQGHPAVAHCSANVTGVLAWQPAHQSAQQIAARLPDGMASLTTVGGTPMLRHVAANPNVDIKAVIAAIDSALGNEK